LLEVKEIIGVKTMTTTSNNNSLTASNNPNLTMQFLTELLAQEPQQVGTRVYS